MARFQKENVPPTTISFQINDNEFDDLKERIDEFKKQNPEELDELCKFVDDVIKDANRKVAEKRNSVSLKEWNLFHLVFSFLKQKFSLLYLVPYTNRPSIF